MSGCSRLGRFRARGGVGAAADIDGRLGLTAIGSSSEEADGLYLEAVEVLAGRQPSGLVALPAATSFERCEVVTTEPA